MGDKPAETVAKPAEIAAQPAEEDKEYDPFAERPQEHLNSDFAVFVHLLKGSIGSGILFLPHGFKTTGHLTAIICSIIIGGISIHTAIVLVQCSQILCKRARTPMLNYAQTAEASFQFGPERLRKYALAVNVLTNVIVCFVQYQAVVIYALYVGTSFQQIIEHFAGNKWNERVYVVLFFPFYCGISLVPNLKYLVPFSIIGTLFLITGFLMTHYFLFLHFESPGRLDLFTNVLEIPVFCTVFLFALHNISMLLPLENTMKKPQHMTFLLTIGMFINILIYIAFGFFGYNKYSDGTCDTVIKNLPLEEIPAQIVKVTITLSVMFSYGIHYYVPISILWPMIAARTKEERHCIYETSFRLGGVVVTTLLAVAVPQMVPLLGLFAALGFTTVMLFIPVMVEIATKWEDPGLGRFKFLLIKNIFILIVWAMLLIVGVFESMKKIIREYGGSDKKDEDSMC